ncbi:hypothetical protein N7492_004268 [Penicillium capsulatum]|uniref:Uncharacterized protein n=1 Tax=Penicillium capsulatum TaxID=69766 RepID=A0A9W9I7I4_9EURO|nr:hypothetical protein N7492_004268 [Penicillium capsulatum]KAJ6136612.1 hypothetical protein N7512_001772 [Penicillium capsulatum]
MPCMPMTRPYPPRRRKWVEDAGKPGCFIAPTNLTFGMFRKQYSFDDPTGRPVLGGDLWEQADQLGLPQGEDKEDAVYQVYQIDHQPRQIIWAGVIVLDDIARPRQSPVPAISEVSQALYARHFAIESLRHVFVTTIINPGTFSFIRHRLYSAGNGPRWFNREDMPVPPVTWEYGSPEYDALLGTHIGKTVAYLVLGAFARGTRRISRIVSWPGYMHSSAYLRFDIARVEGNGAWILDKVMWYSK